MNTADTVHRPLAEETIRRYISVKDIPIYLFSSIDSTNNHAKELLSKGVHPPFLIAADYQTAGRGRRGHSFFSPSAGLYYTLVISPEDESEAIARTTIAAAVSTYEAIKTCTGIETRIKWVNDLYMERRKVCGILCEAPRTVQNTLSGIVIGIGINCAEENFPEELKDIAGALNDPDLDRSRLTAVLTDRLLYNLDHLHDPFLLESYCSHSFLLNKRVSFILNGQLIEGTAVSINEDGNLIVKSDEETYTLQSGEVSLKSWE